MQGKTRLPARTWLSWKGPRSRPGYQLLADSGTVVASSKPWVTRRGSGCSSLIAAAGGEACICDLTAPVALSQPTVSHHMKLLVDAGVVTREQRGKWAYYRVRDNTLRTVAQAITP
jgi:DNA-binding transcriptional ArsR family regulator